MVTLQQLRDKKKELQQRVKDQHEQNQLEKEIQEIEEHGTIKGTIKQTFSAGFKTIYNQADKIAQGILKKDGKKKSK